MLVFSDNGEEQITLLFCCLNVYVFVHDIVQTDENWISYIFSK